MAVWTSFRYGNSDCYTKENSMNVFLKLGWIGFTYSYKDEYTWHSVSMSAKPRLTTILVIRLMHQIVSFFVISKASKRMIEGFSKDDRRLAEGRKWAKSASYERFCEGETRRPTPQPFAPSAKASSSRWTIINRSVRCEDPEGRGLKVTNCDRNIILFLI